MNKIEDESTKLIDMVKELNFIYADMDRIRQSQDLLEETLLRICNIKRTFMKERTSPEGILNPGNAKLVKNSKIAKLRNESDEIEGKIDWLIREKNNFSRANLSPKYNQAKAPSLERQESIEDSVTLFEEPAIFRNDEDINEIIKDFQTLQEMNVTIANLTEKHGLDLIQIEKDQEVAHQNVEKTKIELKKASLDVSEARRRKFLGYFTAVGTVLGTLGGQFGALIGVAAGATAGKVLGDAFTKSSDKKVAKL